MRRVARKSFFETAGIQADPLPDLTVETGPEGRGVGRWVPRDKHRLLSEYLYVSAGARRQWKHQVFIDPFCGPGRIRVEGEEFTRDGGAVAAWRESVASKAPFTQVLIGDKDPERAEACAARLRELGAPVTCFVGSAVDTVKDMVQLVPTTNALSIAYVDPYSLEPLAFDLLRTLSTRKIDMAVHFSVMDLHRNIEMEYDRARFDQAAPNWQDELPAGEHSKSGWALRFFDYWRGLVEGLNFQFSKEMPLVFNNQGKPIYRMVFFARHDLPLRIWGDIAKSQTRGLFD